MSCKNTSVPKPAVGYEVGYAKPPVVSQFKKGQSGNPKGRPKGKLQPRKPLKYELSRELLKDTFLEEAYRMVSINTGKGEEEIPIARAVIRALGVKAAKGHIHAQRLFAQTLLSIEAQNRAQSESSMEYIVEYKKGWGTELARRKELGLPLDPPVPHPDDVVLDMRRGTVEVRGPLSPEEKAKQDYYKSMLIEWRETQARYEAQLPVLLGHEIDRKQREFVEGELAQCAKLIPMLEYLSAENSKPLYF